MKIPTFTLILLLLFGVNLTAQISFTDLTDSLPTINFSGMAVGVTDVNGDCLDDIIRLDGARELKIVFQQPDGSFVEHEMGSISNQRQWAVAAADIDQNGYLDILSGDYTDCRLAMASNDGLSYTFSSLDGNFFVQGSNFVDINGDGWLDAFACNDDGESYIYQNDGTGLLTPANDWIDMSINGSSGEPASGNYGSVWTDFDNDNDLDLYIAKCRQGVGDPSDERRINKLFVNDGNNNFTELAKDYGLRIGWQSWTSDFQDIDNDGDLDCFITNHDFAAQLLENDGSGNFTDITAAAGIDIDMTTTIQGILHDLDNDGFVDILVAGTDQYLYRNNGDRTFDLLENVFSDNDMESCAVGDLNNDGFLDIYAGHAEVFNNPSNIPDVLWMNDGNANNWLRVNLTGVQSNVNGVGARVEIYGEWGLQIREVRAGESYGITNSIVQHFGLGTATAVSHIIVKWPSGVVDVIEQPAVNTCLEITESACQVSSVAITPQGPTVFCSGESVTLSAPEGMSYYWSNGENTQEIVVEQPGNYSVVVEDVDGCYALSTAQSIEVDPVEVPTVEVGGPVVFCEGGSVLLTSSEASEYTWSNGVTTSSVEVTESGIYTVTALGMCDEFTSDPVQVDVIPTAPAPVADDVELIDPGEATLTATGTNLTWYDAPTGGNQLETGSSYYIPFIDAPTTFYVENSEAETNFMEPHDHAGSNYSGDGFNGQVIFNALSSFQLRSVKVITDLPGERIIELRDNTGAVLASATVDIPTGESRVGLDFVIEPDNDYVLTTNEASNLMQFGFASPRLRRSSENIQYPYILDNVAELTASNFGVNRYYYFFDWEVQTPAVDCISDRTPVSVLFVSRVVDMDETDVVSVSPNPGNGHFSLELQLESNATTVLVTDLSGHTLLEKSLGTVSGIRTEQVDASHLAAGTYLVEVQTDQHRYITRLVIQ